MILQSIHVQNWRCFVDPVEVGPFDTGLNVLFAPNATGKSTLFEAMCRGLLDGHRVKGREVEALIPWGRHLAPQVRVTFFHEDNEYRITKTFVENAASVLERTENGRFVPLAEGDKADERVRSMLTRNPPGRGLSRRENWGLAEILWAPQGDLAIAQLSGDLLADIRTSLGVQISGKDAGPIEKKVQEVYARYFTEKGKLKSGKDAPALVRLKARLEKLTEKRSAALTRQREFEEIARRVEDLRARRSQIKHTVEEISKTLAETKVQSENYKTLLSQKAQNEENVKILEAQYRVLKQRIEHIQATRDELKEKKETFLKLEKDVPIQKEEVEKRERETAAAKAEVENARKGRGNVDKAEQLAADARRFLEKKEAITRLDQRIERIMKAEKDLTERKKERSALVAPSEKALQMIRRAIKERDDAQLLIDASLISLEIVAKKDGSVDIVAGEETGKKKLTAGKPLDIKGSPEVVVDMTGVGRFRASGPSGPIEEHRKKKDAAEQELQKLTEGYGTYDLKKLDILKEKANRLDKKITEAETQLHTLLHGESLEDIVQDRSRIDGLLTEILKAHAGWKKNPPDVKALEAKAEKSKEFFIQAIEESEGRWMKAQSTFQAGEKLITELNIRLDETKKQVLSLESRLSDLTVDRKEDREREDDLNKIALQWDANRANLMKVQNKLSVFGDDPTIVVTKLEKQLLAAQEEATKALENEKTQEGMLEHLSNQGPYSALAEAEEELESLKTEIEKEEFRVSAIRLIYDTLSKSRSEALEAVAGPVSKTATRLLKRIAGNRLGSIRLSEDFEPDHVLPDDDESPVSLDSVSGGEKEQIYLTTRLALAEVLAKHERQLVVLDDVLTFTDTARLARITKILEEMSQRLQILILTCHPERYRGLETANFIDLESLLKAVKTSDSSMPS